MSLDAYQHRFQPGADPTAAPLALFHGTGGSAESFLQFGGLVAPDAPKLSVQGDVSEYGAARFFRRRAEGLYDMEDLALRTTAIGAFLEAALPAYDLDPSRTVGVGYSNGANILANLLFERPGALRRLALMHPLIPFDPAAVDLAGVDVLITAGRRDPICPPDQTERLAATLTAFGAGVDLIWRPGGHEVDGGEIEAVRRFAAA